MERSAKLALEDGTVFAGKSIGALGEVDGEVCFNTSMTGYQEILTDPSYCGQIVTMTYPQIGNCGVNRLDIENERPHLAGFVVRELSRRASNYRSEGGLNDYLVQYGIVGLAGIDTRALVRHIRTKGAMKGVLSSVQLEDDYLVQKAQASPGLIGRDLVRQVILAEPRQWSSPLTSWDEIEKRPLPNTPLMTGKSDSAKGLPHVVALDFGMKWNIARHLVDTGCRVTILPGTATSGEVLAYEPDGIFLSNGPGDPEPVDYAIQTISQLLGQAPIFGICLGHQLLCLACGAETFKLKFGHRGANQPVLNVDSGQVEITAQNHGFAVREDSLTDRLRVTHRNLNDNTVAGVAHVEEKAFSVQYHPEASSGPHDSQYLFRQFRNGLK